MYADIPLWLSIVFMLGGLVALAWSSDVFVDGSAAVAKILGVSPLIIGMVIIGFGTSAPELCVSVMSGLNGHADLSLGNAYGSCIFNIAIILGVAVMIFPLVVRPSVAYISGGLLTFVSLFSWFILKDGFCSRADATALLIGFAIIMPLYCWFDQKANPPAGEGAEKRLPDRIRLDARYRRILRGRFLVATIKCLVGLAVLIGSSHFLVWGAVDFARAVGVSDLMIGLTIVAVGTSLPELASAIQSARKGEHEFVLGNIIGSNLFNTLAVVGLATVISPTDGFSPYILTRDLPLMALLSLSIFFFGFNWKHPKFPGAINRKKAFIWLSVFVAYTIIMFLQETGRL